MRAGAQLTEADKVKLRALNQEESRLTTSNSQNKLLAATKAGATRPRRPCAARRAERRRDRGGAPKRRRARKHDRQVGAAAAEHDAAAGSRPRSPIATLRQRIFEASINRAEHGDSNDTRAHRRATGQLRAERAKLLGYPTYAAYALDDQMAKTPEAAIKLLTELVPPATAQGAR